VLAALIIVFREAFEAGLIIGIVLAVTRGVPGRGWWVGTGALLGGVGAIAIALFAGALAAAFEGMGQELFNAAVLVVAVIMLTWHNVFMARHGREMAAEMSSAGKSVAAGLKPLSSLSVVVALAVLREGFEVVLFLYGVVAGEGGSALGVIAGGAAGLLLACLVCFLTYAGLITIPARILFRVTSLIIAFLAAGMAAQAIAYLEQANVLTALDSTVWDSSGILPDASVLGRLLHTLVGYNDRPTGMQLVAYVATLACMFGLVRFMASESGAASARQT
jgi:high-affinity iron transporter